MLCRYQLKLIINFCPGLDLTFSTHTQTLKSSVVDAFKLSDMFRVLNSVLAVFAFLSILSYLFCCFASTFD